MTEPVTGFEQRLAVEVRKYTDSAIRERDWRAAADEIMRSSRARRFGWSGAVAMSVTAAVAAAVTVAIVASSGPLADRQGGGPVNASEAAERLFEVTKTCETEDFADQFHLAVQIPESWWANPRIGEDPIGDVSACVWFAPAMVAIPQQLTERPDGVAITFGTVGGPPEISSGAISQTVLTVAGRQAVRVEEETSNGIRLAFWIPLDGHGSLIASTSTLDAGDFELNKAVLDRMMATLTVSPR
ncbi:MAG: hypothetical protein ACRDHD_03455 [Candidatus Limnocylindria bacterium]